VIGTRFRWLTAGAGLAAAGCTAVVTFHDQPSCDGGLCPPGADATTVGDGGDGLHDASSLTDATPKPDAPYAPCKGLADGHYCADDHLVDYAGASTDLVMCEDGGIGVVTPCGAAGCISMIDPFPDTCSQCPTKPDGNYCGRDFPGFPTEDADFLIGCQSGQVVVDDPCAHGCMSNGSAAACYP